MTDTPKRPWFRFHLLTAVLLMFAAGTMILANMQERCRLVPGDSDLGVTDILREHQRGWPFTAFSAVEETGVGGFFLPNGEVRTIHNEKIPETSGPLLWPIWHGRGIAFDSIVTLTALFLVGLSSECLLRREARKP